MEMKFGARKLESCDEEITIVGRTMWAQSTSVTDRHRKYVRPDIR